MKPFLRNACAASASRSSTPITPGSYQGQTQNGNFVFFTVLSDRRFTGFRVNDVPGTCDGPLTLFGAIDWGQAFFGIDDGGRFVAEDRWTGSDVQGDAEWTSWHGRLTGYFSTPTTVNGTILIEQELNYKGRHYRCTSGEVTWSAALR